MPQINIYVPDTLADALKEHKGELNISQVCAAALRRRIARLERIEMAEALAADLEPYLARDAPRAPVAPH